jgi:hypothetical protein
MLEPLLVHVVKAAAAALARPGVQALLEEEK